MVLVGDYTVILNFYDVPRYSIFFDKYIRFLLVKLKSWLTRNLILVDQSLLLKICLINMS